MPTSLMLSSVRPLVLYVATGLLLCSAAAGQSGFSESSMRNAHGLYVEGRMPQGWSFGQPGALKTIAYTAAPGRISSSSAAEVVDAALPVEAADGDTGFSGVSRATATATRSTRPFQAFAVAAKVGTGGVGLDLATQMAPRINLRMGASFFSYNSSLTEDGLQITGAIKLQNASATVDLYPFNNSFRVSPGLTFKNNNSLNATLLVPGGQSFSLGNNNYTSDPADPIHGSAGFKFGTSNLAPRLTAGFGNMIPRKGGRISFPVEVGFQYTARPTVNLHLTGSSCENVSQNGATVMGCAPVDQISVQQEQQKLQDDLEPLRFYPIASIGVSFRIGGRRVY